MARETDRSNQERVTDGIVVTRLGPRRFRVQFRLVPPGGGAADFDQVITPEHPKFGWCEEQFQKTG